MAQDMRAVIVPKSDQMNADDLITGPRTITITRVDVSDKKGAEQPVSVHYEGDGGKPYKPGLSMRRVMVYAWGPESKDYVGRSMTLYRDATVTWGTLAVGGIRISHMSHLDEKMDVALRATKGVSKAFAVQPLRMQQQSSGIDIAGLTRDAEAAADKGNAALDDFLLRLSKDAKNALRPHGDALRARAAASGQRPAENASSPGPAQENGPSDDDIVYRLAVDGAEQTFDSEGPYITEYRRIVGGMYVASEASKLLRFDQANKPLIESIVGLAETVAAVNAEIRKPASELKL